MTEKQELIDLLIRENYLKTPRIIKAFKKIDRADFVLEQFKKEAYANYPLSIGHNQTISQPATVAFMLELLEPKPGDKILDIGSGSGWQTALLAHIVKQVFAIERIPELKKFGEKNVAKYGFDNIKFICTDGSNGLPEQAPFDKIIIAASAEKMPEILRQQLTENGRLVLPIKNSIWLITKKSQQEFPGFVFVPLIKD
ncbi:MAG: protein-L-isoaspartate(D-aspartate) O-methyltransferase [bacterium]